MQFDQDMIEYCNGTCPPDDAVPADCTIYRAVTTNPAKADDFRSYVDLGKVKREKAKCDDWGLSVWCDMAAVEHARKVIPHFKERFIAAGDMSAAHGVVKASPTRNQPLHHTFWTYLNVTLIPPFAIVMSPEDEDA